MRLMDLMLMVVKKLLESQENWKAKICLSQEIGKARNYLILKKSAKSGKELSKSGNLSNFGTIKAKSKFLIPDIKMALNCS